MEHLDEEQLHIDLKNMLSLLSPKTSIILDEDLALLGKFDSDESETKAYNESIKDGFSDKQINSICNLWGFDTLSRYKDGRLRTINTRGDSFVAVDECGCLIIEEEIYKTYILFSKDKKKNDPGIYGYLFFIKDYRAKQNIDNFFDDEDYIPAVLLYMNGNVYRNDIQDDEISKKYELCESLHLEITSIGEYKVDVNNLSFVPHLVNEQNKIYYGRPLVMNLGTRD